ncbi:MAG: hypothetical protein KGK11_11410 [Sphingomonadales bacterium]|nr:hypothetical protein [Sphingomonadales bacterium]
MRHRLLLPLLLLTAAATPAARLLADDPAPLPSVPAGATVDPLFTQPYVDKDEWRDAPVRHRYVHGGFRGTSTRFSFYFPPAAEYRGRFYQHVTPVPGSENSAQAEPAGGYNKIGFAIASGAYFVEDNEGGAVDIGKGAGILQSDPTIISYRANAAAAQFSRVLAMRMYGRPDAPARRPWGYVYGGSGGAYHTIAGFEDTHGVWDGAVPYVPGSTMAIPNMFTVRIRAMRILDGKFPGIVDAVEPGGSGNPWAGLNREQASVLTEVTKMGFPIRSWFGWKTMGIHGLAALYPGIKIADASFFTDFWTKPGYLGHDHPEQFTGARLDFPTTISAMVTGAEAARLGLNTDASSNRNHGGVNNAFRMAGEDADKRVVALRLAASPPKVFFDGGDLVVESGPEKGKSLPVAHIDGNVVVLGIVDRDVLAKLSPGDGVRVDNSNFLALETYHWHQVPGPDYKVWDQFRRPDGTPIYPQRPMLLGPLFLAHSFGPVETGVFDGRMIIMSSLWDREAMPWQADWYRQRINAHFGAAADDHVRLYYTDYAQHGDEHGIEDPTRTVSYTGDLQQALRLLADWVENGVPPPASTAYRIDDGQVIVPPVATQRGGIQPVATLRIHGRQRADIRAGDAVTFDGRIAAPGPGYRVVAAAWDFDGSGRFAAQSPIAANQGSAAVAIRHRFLHRGTWFVTLRGTTQPQSALGTPFARLDDLDRVRVVVH